MKQTLRRALLAKLSDVVNNQDTDEFSVRSWITALNFIVLKTSELSAPMKIELNDIISKVLLLTLKGSVTYYAVSGIVDSIAALDWRDQVCPDDLNNCNESKAKGAILTNELLQLYVKLVARGLLSSEKPEESITPLFSTATKVYSHDIDEAMFITSPTSDLEQLLGIAPQQVQFHGVGGLESDVSFNLVTMKASLYNSSLFFSDVVRFLFSENIGCSIFGECYVRIAIQNALPHSEAKLGVGNSSVTHAISCEIGSESERIVSCPSGDIVTLSCNGSWPGIYSVTCLYLVAEPVCNFLLGGAGRVNNCTVASFTVYNTTCLCPWNDIVEVLNADLMSGRRLSSQNSSMLSIDFVAMLKYTAFEFKETWTSADSLSVDSIKQSWRVMVTVSVVCGVAALMAFVGSYADHKHVEYTKLAVRPVESLIDSSALSVNNLVEESLPHILRERPFAEKVIREMKVYHRWLDVICFYAEQVSRSVRVLSLVTAAIVMLFANAATYNLGYPDDGKCASHETMDNCLQEQSSFSGGSMCYWLDETKDCNFREPADDMKMVIFTAVIAALVGTPIAVLADIIIMDYIAADTKTRRGTAVKQFDSDSRKSNLISDAATDNLERTSIYSRYRKRTSLSYPKQKNGSSRRSYRNANLAPTTLQEDMSNLLSQIRMFRTGLSGSELSEFDDIWGKVLVFLLKFVYHIFFNC